jgi:hypothetical protein
MTCYLTRLESKLRAVMLVVENIYLIPVASDFDINQPQRRRRPSSNPPQPTRYHPVTGSSWFSLVQDTKRDANSPAARLGYRNRIKAHDCKGIRKRGDIFVGICCVVVDISILSPFVVPVGRDDWIILVADPFERSKWFGTTIEDERVRHGECKTHFIVTKTG